MCIPYILWREAVLPNMNHPSKKWKEFRLKTPRGRCTLKGLTRISRSRKLSQKFVLSENEKKNEFFHENEDEASISKDYTIGTI